VQINDANVTLTGNDFNSPINLTMNLFQHQADIDQLVYGVLTARNLTSFLPAGYFGSEISPGANFSTYEQLEPWVRSVMGVSGHWYGTARMGNDSDTTSVVNTKLQVRGVTGLRVACSSVIPGPVNGQLQATVVAIAEKASDIILDQYLGN